MSLDQHQQTALEMAQNRAIDEQLDFVVQAAVRVASKLKGSNMRENQLRNVLDTALHTESVETVANFIRYQIGRGRDWRHGNFGEEMIAALGTGGAIDRVTAVVVQEVREQAATLGAADGFNEKDTRRQVRMKLVRRFLGELNRAFLYAERTKQWAHLKPLLPAEPAPEATPTATSDTATSDTVITSAVTTNQEA